MNLLLVYLDNTMHNRDISTVNFEHKYLSSHHWLLLIVGKEEKISSKKRRLHTTTACTYK